MSLHPTKTRLALLADVAAGRVFRDAIGDSYISGSRKVTAAIAEMTAAEWVTLPVGWGVRHWQLADTGRALLADRPPAQPATHRVTFDRIGRSHNVAPLETTAEDADELAEQIYRYARPHLVSRDVEVVVDLKAGKAHIYCGFQSGGTGTIQALGGAR